MSKLPDLAEVHANLAFTCIHEADHLPPLDPEADQLFTYGRHLQKRKGPKDFDEIVRYYRIAAAHGHYKANHNAQLLVSWGKAKSPYAMRESIDWATQLVEQNVPMGYYDVGHYLKLGYGFKQNEDMALRYIRKAADMGNPDAQYYIGEMLAPASIAPDIARQMRRCAAEQGHGKAANALGVDLQNDKRYQEAAQAFQLGTAAGHSTSAYYLKHAFKAPPPSDELNYLALPNDPERAKRYEQIWRFLVKNESYNPKLPDIDQIVPLPPAELPPWDGTFQWQKEQEQIPEQPSEALMQKLAKAKNLDPATGLPLPPPPKAALGTCPCTPSNGHACLPLPAITRQGYQARG
ncbi:sel1 repeat family protein [Cupriavidus sp. BIS7]|uniref:SEL1-like repeat protein n=1 Tax=Cupriavidus sp. BIS7 TaxID=1217718 RepID=UPI0002F0792C|nr:sel1 repeat family protein [Cupriavidus sp. BIS7]